MTIQSLQKNIFNSETASSYNETLPAHISAHYLKKRICFFSRYLKPHTSVLDVGCGTGVILASLLSTDQTLELHGCDNSISMLEKAGRQSNIRFVCGASDKLPYKQGAFDMTISVAVFHHLGSKEIASVTIEEMIRITKFGGRTIIWDANSLNPYWLLLFKRVPYDREVKRPMPLLKIISKIKNIDIANVEIFRSGWIPDFVPNSMMRFFKIFEVLMERITFLNIFSAHSVIVLTKRTE
jgi:ubiquinone/menaquinone biosynthesis C-methylase UbiE